MSLADPKKEGQSVDDQQAEAGQIPLEVEQPSFAPSFQQSASHRFHRRGDPARFPQPGRLPGLLLEYDNLEGGRRQVAQSILVDVEALENVAVLGSVHDLVLCVFGFVQRQSQLSHHFHLLVGIRRRQNVPSLT